MHRGNASLGCCQFCAGPGGEKTSLGAESRNHGQHRDLPLIGMLAATTLRSAAHLCQRAPNLKER
jgi:hypothetical protein